jgi:predicted dehydrogenase
LEIKRISVIGAGYISRCYHCPALVKLKDKNPWVELAAVCDLVPERAREAANVFGFKNVYTDIESLLNEEKVDAAYILIDPGHIKDAASRFIRRGIPCLIEKPPGKNSSEVKELLETARTYKVPCLVALNRRFMPLAVRAKEILNSLEHQPQIIEAQILRHKRTDNDFAFSTAVHSMDLMRFFMGDVLSFEVEKQLMQDNQVHSYLVDFKYRTGALGRLTIWPEAGVDLERYTIHGHDFSLFFEAPLEWTADFPGRISFYNGKERHYIQDNRNLSTTMIDPLEVTGFLGESAHFLECLKKGIEPNPSLADCVQSIEISEATQSGRGRSFD